MKESQSLRKSGHLSKVVEKGHEDQAIKSQSLRKSGHLSKRRYGKINRRIKRVSIPS